MIDMILLDTRMTLVQQMSSPDIEVIIVQQMSQPDIEVIIVQQMSSPDIKVIIVQQMSSPDIEVVIVQQMSSPDIEVVIVQQDFFQTSLRSLNQTLELISMKHCCDGQFICARAAQTAYDVLVFIGEDRRNFFCILRYNGGGRTAVPAVTSFVLKPNNQTSQ